jgi:NAD(P)-dependent dehydrogenase (short-subunit alcohol dehydrogenase family)
MTVRNIAQSEQAIGEVREHATGKSTIEVHTLELGSLASVRACADRLLADPRPLHVLFANAGIMACPRGTTQDGFEMQMGTNHVGHFALIDPLVPLLIRGAPARIVVTSSSGHRIADVNLDDPDFERTPYDPWESYARSKTANVLFAIELDRRLHEFGVRACALHPGAIHTGLARHLTPESTQAMMQRTAAWSTAQPLTFKTIKQSAATQVWAGVVANAAEVAGRYCEDCAVASVNDDPASAHGVRSYALDPLRARELWAASEEWVSQRFPQGT